MQKVILDLLPGGVAPIVYASQNDDKRTIRFELVSGGDNDVYVLSGNETITAKITKPDGTAITVPITNPGSGKHYVDLVNGADDYDQAGAYLGEIILTRNTKVIGSANFVLKVEEDAYDGQITTLTATGNPCTFDTDLADNLVSLTAEIVATGGNGTPSTPIPINGYTEANITRCGVNVWNEEWELSGSTVVSKYPIRVTPNTTYFIACPVTADIDSVSESGQYISYITSKMNGIFTTPADCNYIKFTMRSAYGTTYNNDISINYPSSKTAYTPYNGQTYTIAFGQTVYGGVLDVTRGKLHVDKAYKDLGDLNWNYSSGSGLFYSYGLSDAYAPQGDNTYIANALCSIFGVKSRADLPNNNYCFSINYSDTKYLSVKDTDYTDSNDFKTAVTGQKLVYEVNEPFDIDLTPVQISALVGTNNITSDLGGDVDVTYIKKV